MTAGTFTAFAAAAQVAADALLAQVQREQPDAAAHLAEAIESGAALSMSLTIRGSEAWAELILRTPDAMHSIACVPLSVKQARRN